MTQPGPAVVLSPHLDDAVFSCPGWIREHAQAGEHPIVVTVFSHASVHTDEKALRIYEQRQREDEQAVQLLGASRRLAGFPDAPFRSPSYASFSGMICDQAEEDDLVFQRVKTYLAKLFDDIRPRRVLAPLGVGQHIDHRILHDVASELAAERPGTSFGYYEDRPYAFVEEAVRLRLGQLQRRSSADDFARTSPAMRSERFFLSFFGAPYARQHLRAADQARIVAHMLETFVRALQEPTRSARWSTSAWAPEVLRDLLPALDAYASQARGFLGSPLYHQWAAMEYARRMGYVGQYVERYWYL